MRAQRATKPGAAAEALAPPLTGIALARDSQRVAEQDRVVALAPGALACAALASAALGAPRLCAAQEFASPELSDEFAFSIVDEEGRPVPGAEVRTAIDLLSPLAGPPSLDRAPRARRGGRRSSRPRGIGSSAPPAKLVEELFARFRCASRSRSPPTSSRASWATSSRSTGSGDERPLGNAGTNGAGAGFDSSGQGSRFELRRVRPRTSPPGRPRRAHASRGVARLERPDGDPFRRRFTPRARAARTGQIGRAHV